MKRKTIIISILVAVILSFASVTSVVAYDFVKSNAEKRNITSPLFTVRAQRSINKENHKTIYANYLGNGEQPSIAFPEKSKEHVWVDKAIKLFDKIILSPRMQSCATCTYAISKLLLPMRVVP